MSVAISVCDEYQIFDSRTQKCIGIEDPDAAFLLQAEKLTPKQRYLQMQATKQLEYPSLLTNIEEVRKRFLESIQTRSGEVSDDQKNVILLDFLLSPIAIQYLAILKARGEEENEKNEHSDLLLQLVADEAADVLKRFSDKENVSKEVIMALASILVHTLYDVDNEIVKTRSTEDADAYLEFAFGGFQTKGVNKYGSKRIVDAQYLNQEQLQKSLPQCSLLTEKWCKTMPNTCIWEDGKCGNVLEDDSNNKKAIIKQEPTRQTLEIYSTVAMIQSCNQMFVTAASNKMKWCLKGLAGIATLKAASVLAAAGSALVGANALWQYLTMITPELYSLLVPVTGVGTIIGGGVGSALVSRKIIQNEQKTRHKAEQFSFSRNLDIDFEFEKEQKREFVPVGSLSKKRPLLQEAGLFDPAGLVDF